MMTEDHVSFETAKLLKEKGFNEYTPTLYNSDGEVKDMFRPFSRGDIWRPTLQTARKWLRKEKHYYIQIMLDGWALGDHLGYYIVILDTNSDLEILSPTVDENNTVFFKEPEDAAEAAIKYVLENLV